MAESHYVPAWPRDLIPNRMNLAIRFLHANGIVTEAESADLQQRVSDYAKREYRKVDPPVRSLGERIAEVLPEHVMAPYLKEEPR